MNGTKTRAWAPLSLALLITASASAQEATERTRERRAPATAERQADSKTATRERVSNNLRQAEAGHRDRLARLRRLAEIYRSSGDTGHRVCHLDDLRCGPAISPGCDPRAGPVRPR